ncbi:MAG: hypothetical protein JXR83_15405 [Deltaproteobacteria bacterium]|nr:hypothetical protein [Deltaproteobacteria bacterium]
MRTDTQTTLTAVALVSLIAIATGCPSAAIHRTARTLDPGQSELSATANVGLTGFSAPTSEGTPSSSLNFAMPGVVPVLSYHLGVVDNFEVGANVSPLTLSIDLDTKWRMVRLFDNRLSIALQPTVGLNALLLAWGATGTLPLIATFDITDMFSISGWGYGRAGQIRMVPGGTDTSVTSVGAGLGAGVEVRGDSFFMMPMIEANSGFNFFGNRFDSYLRTDVIQVGVAIGYHGDLLRIMDRKLDKIDGKVDRLEKKVDDGFERIDQKLDAIAPAGATSAPASGESGLDPL